jgi:sugar (pentulose or hexulose) kinase
MMFLGIDIGTTRTKAVVHRAGATDAISHADEPTPVSETDMGTVHRTDAVLEVVLRVAEAALARVDKTQVRGIAVASVGEEIVLVDRHGVAVDDVITWSSLVGRSEAEQLYGGLDVIDASSPVRPDPRFSLFKLAWMAVHRPGSFRRAAGFTDLGSFISCRMGGVPTGRLVMDWSHASRTGLFDPSTTTWVDPLLRPLGVEDMVPSLAPSGTVIGAIDPSVARQLGLARDVLIMAGGHDHFCAAYACGIQTSGVAFVSAGTSEAHLILADRAPSVPAASNVDTGRFVDLDHHYLHAMLPSGDVYRHWRRLLYLPDEFTTMADEVARVPIGSDGVRCVVDPVTATVSLGHVRPGAPRAVIMRAIMEGTAIVANILTDRLETVSGSPVERILAVGVAFSEPVWRAIRVALSTRPIDWIEIPDTTAIGAAMLAECGVQGSAQPLRPRPDRLTVDDDVRSRYRALQDDYQRVLARMAT